MEILFGDEFDWFSIIERYLSLEWGSNDYKYRISVFCLFCFVCLGLSVGKDCEFVEVLVVVIFM